MTFLFLLLVCSSEAGTQVWGDGGSAASLFSKYCSGSQDRGVDGNFMWICKRAQRVTPQVESYLHIFETVPQSPSRKEIIFLENPGNEYKHMILVQGQVFSQPKTNVFVLPGRDRHTYAVTDNIKSNQSLDKPSIFFAKSPDSSEVDYPTTHRDNSNRFVVTTQDDNSNGFVTTEDDNKYIQSDKDENELSVISAAHSFEYRKQPSPPTYVKRRRVKLSKIIREKRNYGVKTGQAIRPTSEEKKKRVTLHYRRRNPARFGFGLQKQGEDGPEEFVSAASSYYPSPYQHLRPVYIRPQN